MSIVGSAKPEDIQGKDLHGKIAYVKRDSQYHRSSQYRNVSQAGALAMLYESAVPGNQIQIGSTMISTARPIMFDRYVDNRGTGSFILIDPSSNFTSGAGMIAESLGARAEAGGSKPTAAERLARVARAAASDADAIEAVRRALEELLT